MSDATLTEVELYTFANSSAQFRLTPHEFDVNLDGSIYKSMPMKRSELVVGAEAAKSALVIEVPHDSDLAHHLLATVITGAITSVTLHVARLTPDPWDNLYWDIVGTRWMGRVLNVEFTDDVARIRCESAQVSLKRIGLRRLYSRKCSHVLYSAACGASPITASAVIESCTGIHVGLTDEVPASVRGTLAGGWVQMPDGTRHMIMLELTVAFVLLYPVDIEPGTVVQLTAGCDHTTTTCQTRFNNLDNFGGFPAIPKKNPFSTAVF